MKILKMDRTNQTNEEILKLQKAVESSDEAIFITDLNGLITFINPGFTKLYGYSADEVIDKTTPRILKSGVMKPDDYIYFWTTILDNQVIRLELVNKTKDGRLITVEGSANPILNDKQEIIGFIGVQHDITPRKKSEEALRKSEEKFRKAFMTSPDAININRLSDGLFISINEGFTRIVGYKEEEAIGKTSLELNIWADHENRKSLVKELQENGRVENFEAIFLKKNGSIIYGLMSASLIDLDGVTHILSISRDITRRKLAEEALAHEQHLMESLMNNVPDHIFFKDLESRFLRINRSHSQSFGLDNPEQATGKTDFDFFTREHAQQAFDDEQAIIHSGQTISQEEKETWADRPDTWVLTTKIPFADRDGKIIGTFGISRDITKRKRTELESQIIYEITQGVTITSNLDELLKLINHSLGKVVYAENCFVA